MTTFDPSPRPRKTPLDLVLEAAQQLEQRRLHAAHAEQWFRSTVQEALAAGETVANVADVAGISRERVYQIRDGRR